MPKIISERTWTTLGGRQLAVFVSVRILQKGGPGTKEANMSEQKRLVVMITHGTDHELSSVGFTIANGGITAGLKVSVFLTSAGVDLVRRGAVATTQVPPLEPLDALVKDFLKRGGTLWACTPCVKARGYTQDHLIEGTIITGASVMHEELKAGAATLSF
jgi:predicted peroxiredoxin